MVLPNEKFIKLIRLHQELYDVYHSKYKDVNHKDKIWIQIGREVNMKVDACKKRWQNIRDNFRKTLKQRKAKTGQDPMRINKYLYEDQLQFLYPFLNGRKANMACFSEEETNASEIEPQNDVATTTIDLDLGATFEDNCIEPDNRIEGKKTVTIEETISDTPCKKIKNDTCTTKTTETASSILMNYILKRNEAQQTSHPVDSFLNGIAPILKSLTPYHLNLARSKIFKEVHDIELSQLMHTQNQHADGIPFHSSMNLEQRIVNPIGTVECISLALPPTPWSHSEYPNEQNVDIKPNLVHPQFCENKYFSE